MDAFFLLIRVFYDKLFTGESMKKRTIIILSIITSFCLYCERILVAMAKTYKRVKAFKLSGLTKFTYANNDFLLYLLIAGALIIFYTKFKDIKRKKGYNILAFIFTLFLVLGFSYSVVGSSALVTGSPLLVIISIIRFVVYYKFLAVLLNVIAEKLKDINWHKKKIPEKLKKLENIYEKHPIKMTIIIILVAWLPYIISFYPAILSPDPSNQIKQYFGIRTLYAEAVNLVDPNVLITNHHPVFHTFILGGFAKIGANLGSINLGIFLFTVFQLFIVISAILYTLLYLKKLKVPFIYRFSILVIFALVPVFPLYALSSVKDTMFGALLVFLVIEFHKLITNKNYSIKEYLVLSLLLLIMMLVRNNGIYIILFSVISLIFMLKEKRRALILVLLSSVLVYQAHNKILLPAMHISMGSVREMLSVPFQQTARYAKYYSEDLKQKEIQVIDKVLGYETLRERYKPNIADPVKNEFNKDTTTKDLVEYFKVWFSCFFRHPGVYFDATINTVYGYFYPNTANWYVYHDYDERLIQDGIDYHYNNLKGLRNVLTSMAVTYQSVPILNTIINIGFVVWTYMFLVTYLIIEKKKKLIPLLFPAFVLLLTCVVGPVNTYFRYMFPIVISLPLIIGLLINEKKS